MTTMRLRYLLRPREVSDRPSLPVLSVYRDHGVIPKDSRTDNFNVTPADLTRYQEVRAGDLVINKMKAWQGSLGVSSHHGIVSPDYLVCSIHSSADSHFLHHLLRSAPVVAQYGARSKGIRPAQWRIYWEDLAEICVNLPPLEEQRRIANFLDVETTRISQLHALRVGQLRVVNERFDSLWSASIDDVAKLKGWLPLRRVLIAITDGPFGSSLASDHYSTRGARVIRLGNIGKARFRDDDVAYISESHFQDLRRHEVRAGDLIMAGLGDESHPLGRACIAPSGLGHAIVKADCFRLRLDPSRITHEYAAWALSSPLVASRVVEMSRGSTRPRVNLSIVRGIAIPVPTLAEQREVVTSLVAQREVVDAASTASNLQLARLAERRQALITAAVTGQIDVTTARAGGGAA